MNRILAELQIGDELFWEPVRVVPPEPWVGHIPFAFWLIKALRPEIFVELGTHSGNSFFAFCQAIAFFGISGRAFAVDTWKGDEHAGDYGEEVFEDLAAFHNAHYLGFATLLRTTFDDARNYFAEASIDLLHIDGLHSYEGVKHDFDNWYSALSRRAVVVFHDINVRERGFGVWKLWQELSDQYPSFQFDHSHGLGVLGVGQDQVALLQRLFEMSKAQEAALGVRRWFSSRGVSFQRLAQVSAREAEVQRLRAMVADREDEVGRVQREQLSKAKDIGRLHDEILARQAEVQQLRAAIKACEQQIASLANTVTARDGEIGLLSDRIVALHNSTCWRITAPLRSVVLGTRSGVSHIRRLSVRAPIGGIGDGSLGPAPAARDYAEWIARYDTLDDGDRHAIAAAVTHMTDPLLISVLMPVYETPLPYLRAAIESVRAQLYPHWELCIADDASKSPEVRRILDDYRTLDQRIKVCYRDTNGHISAATNTALELAEGRFVALLDHDDVLPEHALFEVATAIADDPQIDLIYTDEDKIDNRGQRFAPYFKSDWNPDLLLSQNMFNHLGVYRRSLVEEVSGFREGYEGSQDYDLVLRASTLTTPERIRHIPHILYHWRAVGGSVALSPDEKDYPVAHARRAISDHLRERGIAAEVGQGLFPNFHRVRYLLPDPAPRVSIVIPTRDRVDLLQKCIEGILHGTNYHDFEILIIDNQSREPATLAYLRALTVDPRVRILAYDKPFNYSAINNFAAAEATGSLLCLLNNDIQVIAPDWLTEMASHAMRPGIGAVGALLYYPDDRVQHAGVITGIGGVAGHAHHGLCRGDPGYFGRAALVQNLSAVTGACLVMPKCVYHQFRGLNATELAVAFNDVDLCLRIREAGYQIVWTPHAQLYHHESASRGPDTHPDKIERFRAEVAHMMLRWGQVLDRDPYYNPNLRLDGTDFGLAFPPRITKSWLSNPEPPRGSAAGRA
jgi:glycosyltransferase involved in cell wall biosynthesis